MKIVRKFDERDELYGARNCRNCKYAESNANLEVSCPYDYSKSKNYIEDYYCKKNNSIVNSTSVCDKWKGM